jgi:hypothetical protein
MVTGSNVSRLRAIIRAHSGAKSASCAIFSHFFGDLQPVFFIDGID